MQNEFNSEKKRWSGGLFALVLALVVVLAAVVAFVALGGASGMFARAQEAYRFEGPVRAMGLQAPSDTEEEAMREYFTQAADFASEQGINTIIFDAKQGLSVWWRDEIFPAAEGVAEQDGTLGEFDPLEVLCEVMHGREIQLWIQVDPYGADNYSALAQGEAVQQAIELAGADEFSAADEEYRQILVQSLAALPEKYAIAGIVLQGRQEAEQPGFEEGLSSMVRQLSTAIEGGESGAELAAMAGGEHGGLSPDMASVLQQEGVLEHVMLYFEPSYTLYEDIAAAAGEGIIITPQSDVHTDSDGLVFFTAAQSAGEQTGYLLGSYPQAQQPQSQFALLGSALAFVEGYDMPSGFDIPQYLEVTYPEVGSVLTWENVYITGHSNPNEPLLMNGAEVSDRAPNGAFGVYVALAEGDNYFVFTNGGDEMVKVVTRGYTAVSGGGTGSGTTVVVPEAEPEEPPTANIEVGQAIRIESQIASALEDYTNTASMNETFTIGATAVVQNSVEFYNGSSYVEAYQITSGDWVFATNCSFIDDAQSSFTGLSAQPHEQGEYIVFEGSGAPAAYIEYDDNSGELAVTMYDTSFELAEGFASGYVSSAVVQQQENATILTLQTEGIWGYNIEYENGQTRLFIKKVPELGEDVLRPLEGVHVLLDPGHGQQTAGSNYGAVGIAGQAGYPHEKDINLALSQAIAYRLRQLGATVSFTREDDLNPSTSERLAVITELKPDFFISVHHDGLDGYIDLGERDYMLSFYYHPYSVPPSAGFAQSLMDEMREATGRRGDDATWGYYSVTRTTLCPAVLYEYGMLVNPQHYYESTSTDGIYAAAYGTAQAILNMIPQGG